jgi:hypothetical protein
VSLAEPLTAGMLVWNLLQQTGLDMCWVVLLAVSFSWLSPLCEGGKAATATVAVGRDCSSGTVNIHSVYHADVYMCVKVQGFAMGFS